MPIYAPQWPKNTRKHQVKAGIQIGAFVSDFNFWLKCKLTIRSDEGIMLEASAFKFLYGGQFTLSTQLIKPNDPIRCWHEGWVVRKLVNANLGLKGEQGWRSGESARPPPMCPGFDSRTRHHMWAEFVGSLLCSERFFSGYSGFPLSSKTNIWFDLFDLLDLFDLIYLIYSRPN